MSNSIREMIRNHEAGVTEGIFPILFLLTIAERRNLITALRTSSVYDLERAAEALVKENPLYIDLAGAYDFVEDQLPMLAIQNYALRNPGVTKEQLLQYVLNTLAEQGIEYDIDELSDIVSAAIEERDGGDDAWYWVLGSLVGIATIGGVAVGRNPKFRKKTKKKVKAMKKTAKKRWTEIVKKVKKWGRK